MAKNIWICSKNDFTDQIEYRIREICKRISPDNIKSVLPHIKVNEKVAFGITNPTSTILIDNNNLLLGKIFGDFTNWQIPLSKYPDGSFALFRENKEFSEIVSDSVASRAIWYYFDDENLIASTSQRAIILFIGNFEFNEKIIPWMLANGTLGPLLSWDKRIQCLPPDSSLILDKKDWKIRIKSNPIVFSNKEDTRKNHEKNLRETLISTFSILNLNYNKWVLPISGGYDSRGILCLLNKSKIDISKLKTITWGLKSSLQEKDNDAFIAKELAKAFKLPHKYFHTDLSEEPVEIIIDRFLLNGEGRIDQISGYIDGFKIWKILFEEGFQGIIRGDEGFGCKYYSSSTIARINQASALCTDFLNLKDYQDYGIPKQELPESLIQRTNETIAAYRDRLFHQHAFITHFSALTDLKSSYLEVINPLLSRDILQNVRQLPDQLRTNKILFKKIIKSISPSIPFALRGANAQRSDILKQNKVVELIINELSSNAASELFNVDFLTLIMKNLKTTGSEMIKENSKSSVKEVFKKIIPIYFKNIFRDKLESNKIIDYNIIAFRILIIIKMNRILKETLIDKFEIPNNNSGKNRKVIN